ncbi:MAG TPA: hypothetical protein VM324_01590 [Egibacteraceae bacterium]|jgi:hypothetical protein|nr:hypothetical protein [Egibacteraceae bacterium]
MDVVPVDDRILPVTRLVAAVVAPILAVAGVLLYLFPAETERLWAWPMDPPMTALAVGGGYLAGAVLFARAARERCWHTIGVVFLAATALSGLLLVATFLHWDRFTHGHVSFWAWLALYLVTPWLLPLLWLRNRRHDPGAPAEGDTVPDPMRLAGGALGAALLTVALAMFVHPPLATGSWPWSLTPLTARTVSAFLAFIGILLLVSLFERRWSALRLHVESATLGLALVAVGAVRARGDFDGPAWAVAAFFMLLGGVLAVLVGGWTVMQRTGGAQRPDGGR